MIGAGAAAPDEAWLELLCAGITGLATAGFTWLLARLAERSGFVDDGSDAPLRKLQARPVAPIGGTAIVCGSALGIIVAAWIGLPNGPAWLDVSGVGSSAPARSHPLLLLALVAAFAVGLCDDLRARGLPPLPKLIGQMIAAGLLAFASAADGGALRWESLCLWFAAGVVAQNALNTFDNADGAATALGLMGLAPVMPLVAGALCGFLPFNLWIRPKVASDASRASVPRAYLGDSGSHVLGLLLLLHPQSRLALFVPILDLARVAFVRLRRGSAPWIGDRRHLAHRMQARGWTPTAVVSALCLIALPLVGAGLIAASHGGGRLILGAGTASSILFFCVALHICPARE